MDEGALALGRRVTYTAEQVADVSPDLRDEYFEPAGEGFACRGDLRRAVVFGRHDLVQDPPISRIDLLIARNTLMYFDSETQSGILDGFHFADERRRRHRRARPRIAGQGLERPGSGAVGGPRRRGRGERFLELDIGLPVDELGPSLQEAVARGASREVVLDAVNRRGRRLACTVRIARLETETGEPRGAIVLMATEPAARVDAAGVGGSER